MGLVRDKNGVVQMLSWVDAVLATDSASRKRLVAQALKDLETFKSLDDQPTEEGRELSRLLRSSEFELIGITPNIMYIRVQGTKEDLEPIWVHPWALPALVFRHKKSCSYIVAGVGIRWNKTALQEMPMNRAFFKKVFQHIAGIIGWTG